MASSRVKYPINQPDQFYKNFPHLNGTNHEPTSLATPEPDVPPKKPYYIYNCFAFVVDDRKKFWWPDYPYSYWPREDGKETVEELMSVLKDDYGYEPCDDGKYEEGVQKVAIFAKNNVPVHIAVQPSSRNGDWFSKMGYNVDMQHVLHAVETWDGDNVETKGYGTVAKYMKLVRKGRKASR